MLVSTLQRDDAEMGVEGERVGTDRAEVRKEEGREELKEAAKHTRSVHGDGIRPMVSQHLSTCSHCCDLKTAILERQRYSRQHKDYANCMVWSKLCQGNVTM
eukprot:EG_transcript_56822